MLFSELDSASLTAQLRYDWRAQGGEGEFLWLKQGWCIVMDRAQCHRWNMITIDPFRSCSQKKKEKKKEGKNRNARVAENNLRTNQYG